MYDVYTAVLRAVLPCPHEKITIFRGALETPMPKIRAMARPLNLGSPRINKVPSIASIPEGVPPVNHMDAETSQPSMQSAATARPLFLTRDQFHA